MIRFALFALIVAQPALACKCPGFGTPCNEAVTSDLVFVGTVESVSPKFFDSWNTSQLSMLRTLNQQADAARGDKSDSNLTALRDTYLKIFPDLPEDSRRRLATAKTHDELVRSFYFIVSRGKMVHLNIRAKYQDGHDEDDDKKPAAKAPDKDKPKAKDDDDLGAIDVWTPFDDCGVDFQVGETYLVYANNDEESLINSTSACTRTRRVSDAGEDLSYLFFLKSNEKQSTELDGYLTTNQHYQKDFASSAEPAVVSGAVTDAVVELTQKSGVRFALPDATGRFVFDGLSEGQYALNVYAAGYPRRVQQLAGPQKGVLKEKSCAREFVLLSKPPDR